MTSLVASVQAIFEWKYVFFFLTSFHNKVNFATKMMQRDYLCVKHEKLLFLMVLTWFLILGKIQDGSQNAHHAKVEWSFNTDETSQDPRWLVGKKHFPESQTLPRIQKPFTESKKHPRIWMLRHDLDSLGRVLGVLGSVYGLWELFEILHGQSFLPASHRL